MGTMTATEVAGTVALLTALGLVACCGATVLLVALLPPALDQTPWEVIALLIGGAVFAAVDLATLVLMRRARLAVELAKWQALQAIYATDRVEVDAELTEWAA
jgi:hypothetical protein